MSGWLTARRVETIWAIRWYCRRSEASPDLGVRGVGGSSRSGFVSTVGEGTKSLTEGGAAKHGRGVLHVRDRSIVCVLLGLIVRREGSVVMFYESERGCHQVYLCHAPSAVRKGGTSKVAVSVWHTRRLRARSKVADQSTG